MPVGRRPKPRELKVLEGNRGKRKIDEGPPIVMPEGVPEPPASLEQAGLAYWQRAWTSASWLAMSDYSAVVKLCKLEDLAVEMEQALKDEGLLHPAESSGRSAPHYLLNSLLGIYGRQEALESALALTPTDRSRIKVETKQSDPAEEFIRGRRGA